MRAKQGISSPEASLGKYFSFCSLLPYFKINSAGPSELGTPTVIASVEDKALNFSMIIDCAYDENDFPPYFLGILSQKTYFFSNNPILQEVNYLLSNYYLPTNSYY